MHVAVLGSGLSGLTAAVFLARDGCGVEFFEQAGHIGGVTSTICREGFAWDQQVEWIPRRTAEKT